MMVKEVAKLLIIFIYGSVLIFMGFLLKEKSEARLFIFTGIIIYIFIGLAAYPDTTNVIERLLSLNQITI